MSSTVVVPATTLPAAWTQEQERIIKDQVAGGMNPPITNAEFAYFAEVCRTRRLSPIAGQIVPVRRGGKMIIQTTIHGLRAMADETGDYAPGSPTRFITTSDDKLFSATAYVLKYVHGTWHEVAEVAHWDEYRDDRSPIWKDKPRLMLAKCAEALALRRAFPAKLGGIYTDDELGPERAEPAERARPRAVTPSELSGKTEPAEPPASQADRDTLMAIAKRLTLNWTHVQDLVPILQYPEAWKCLTADQARGAITTLERVDNAARLMDWQGEHIIAEIARRRQIGRAPDTLAHDLVAAAAGHADLAFGQDGAPVFTYPPAEASVV